MADQMQPTPRSTILGLFSDIVNLPLQYMSSPERTQQMQGTAQFLYETGIPKTLERLSYGDSLFSGSGMTLRPRDETINAAMTVAPFAPAVGRVIPKVVRATEGMPVGMSIKPINLNKGIYKPELTMEEMLKVKDIPTVDRVRQSIDLVGEKEFEKMVNAQYSKYKPSDVDQEAMLVESVTLNILGKAQRSPYPQQAALDLAQERAALPIEQGGLGLPANNTAADRAKAMGFESGYVHGSPNPDITNLRPSITGAQGEGIYATNYLPESNMYSGTKEGATNYPLYVNTQKALDVGEANPYDVLGFDLQSQLAQRQKDAMISRQKETEDWLIKNGVPFMPSREHYVSILPENFRSRFAAFDPFRKDVATATAMGVAAPDLLAQPVEQYPTPYETSPMYTDPFGNTIGSSIR
jgi:hypothetical protein